MKTSVALHKNILQGKKKKQKSLGSKSDKNKVKHFCTYDNTLNCTYSNIRAHTII